MAETKAETGEENGMIGCTVVGIENERIETGAGAEAESGTGEGIETGIMIMTGTEITAGRGRGTGTGTGIGAGTAIENVYTSNHYFGSRLGDVVAGFLVHNFVLFL